MTRNVPWVLKGVEQKQMFHNHYISMTPNCSHIWKLNSVEFWGRVLKTKKHDLQTGKFMTGLPPALFAWYFLTQHCYFYYASSISVTFTDDLDRPGVLSCTVPIWHSLRSGNHDLSIPSCFIKKQIWTNPGVRGALTGTSKWGPVEGPGRGQTGGGVSWSKPELCWRCLWEKVLKQAPWELPQCELMDVLVYELDSADHPGLSFYCQNGH